MDAKPKVEKVFLDIRKKAVVDEGKTPGKTNMVYASEIEETVEAVSTECGIPLSDFLDFFENHWLIGKIKRTNSSDKTVYSVTVNKFYQALCDWLLFKEADKDAETNGFPPNLSSQKHQH